MPLKCPGEEPKVELQLLQCPQCGSEVEIFTNEEKIKCANCGTQITRPRVPSWYQYEKPKEKRLEADK